MRLARKEAAMDHTGQGTKGRCGLSGALGAFLLVAVLGLAANTKPTELPARVIAHVPLKDAPGSEMLLQIKADKHYLYVQQASKQGFMVIDVTKPSAPNLVNTTGSSANATAGKLEMVSPDVALAKVPDRNSKGVIHSSDNPTETVRVLDVSDPAHPKVIQTFSGVTSTLQDPGRGLIYLTNNDGLWILRHPRPGIQPAKTKKPCNSADAIASMPPDCQ
jgi:LVIVD repeat